MLGRKNNKKAVPIDESEADEPLFSVSTRSATDREVEWPLSDESSPDDQLLSDTSDTGLTSWINEEDKLPIDVYQDDSYIYLKAPVPGADVKDIDITIDNDLITIRVQRYEDEHIQEEDYFFQECFWGSLSRSIILPTEIDPNAVKASLRNGIVTVTLPKINRSTGTKVSVVAED